MTETWFHRSALIRIVAIGLALAWSAPAFGGNKEAARTHVALGDTHYKLGRFAEALAEYSKAYELYPTPPLLFNLGQCHRNLKQWSKAVFFFEGYLRERPAAKNRALVEDLLAESRRELEKEVAQETAKAVAEAARKADEQAAARRRADELEKARLEADRQQIEAGSKLKLEAERRRIEDERIVGERMRRERDARERERNRFYRRWWFWSAVGGAALAAGGTVYYFSGSTTIVPPSGTLGDLDRR